MVKDHIPTTPETTGLTWVWSYELDSADELNELCYCCNRLFGINIPGGVDKWNWLGESYGEFSVRSLKRLL
ncbi:hypothetical protein HanIR_Chr02g0083041 [Helianthus annuus]|nr:hypothetical protein HanIR_Chr02g0083041 [Helianthus annuus]